MRTAEETLFETCNSFLNSDRRNLTIEEFREEISSDREIKETLNSIEEAMKAYAKEALKEADRRISSTSGVVKIIEGVIADLK